MIFSAQELVSRISHDMTLLPGDLIAVGTSVGVGVMKEQLNTVTVAIDGIGELTNEFRLEPVFGRPAPERRAILAAARQN